VVIEQPQTKQLTLRLDLEIYESFFRIFPKHGQVSYILRAVVREIIKQAKTNPELVKLPDAVQTVLNSAGMKLRL
jgi:hypothetical protein